MVLVCRSDSTRVSDQEDWVDAFNLPAPQAAQPVDRLQRLQRWRWNELGEKVAYRYFCWRFGLLFSLVGSCTVHGVCSVGVLAANATLASV